MKKCTRAILPVIAIMALLLLNACRSQENMQTQQDIPYTIAQHYFFNNDQQIPTDAKVRTQKRFEELFGMAAVMGKNGTPTPIDFKKQFAIAIVLPVTNVETKITMGRLEANEDNLTLYYQVTRGKSLSNSMQPMSLIFVDKKYEKKNVVLVEK